MLKLNITPRHAKKPCSTQEPSKTTPVTAKGGSTTEGSTKRKPVVTFEAFAESHLHDDKRIKEYLNRRRKRSAYLSPEGRVELRSEAAKFLCANNAEARIKFAKAVNIQIRALIEAGYAEFVWFTLTPKQYFMTEKESLNFDFSRLQSWTREELKGINFFAMVDLALYTNVSALVGYTKRGISWHVHGIAWGITKSQFRKRKKLINARFESIMPGLKVCDSRMLDADTILGKGWYMEKGPQSEYRVYPIKEERTDRETGELTKHSTGKFRQNKRALRPGDLVKMREIMVGTLLDKLSFGNCDEGKAFHHAVTQRALRRLNKALARQKEMGRAAWLHIGCQPDPAALLT